jgi:predicted nucleic acid-binding protein
MIVVDTSVWVDHFRDFETPLLDVLNDGIARLHPFVMGELMLGGLPRNGGVASGLNGVPAAPVASIEEVAALIAWANLAGTGVGYVDAHLLVSTRLIAQGRLLTFDKSLHAQALRLGVAYLP